MYKCNSMYMTNTISTSNQSIEEYIGGYLQYESSLKENLYYGEIDSFKKSLQNIEWNNL